MRDSSHRLPRDVEKVALSVMEQLNSPKALEVKSFIVNGEWDDLALCKVDPRTYVDSAQYFADAAAVAFLKKHQGLPGSYTPEKRRSDCENQFFESEKQCYRTNLRLRDIRLNGNCSLDMLEFIKDVRKIIRRILGGLPLELEGKFGPGATYGDKGVLSTVGDKITSVPTLYPNSDFVEPFWGETSWRRALYARRIEPEVVRGNRFTAVPKDATRDRGICVEASISGFYQLGVGREIRKRLLSVGIDLNHGQATHRQVAREASLHGGYATLDLRNASDTVSYEVVKLLLPTEWFDLLDWLRAPATLIRGNWVHLEKFSSMGNGYTFELETLIYYAITAAVRRRSILVDHPRVLVYGDDIICPTSMANVLVSALTFFGFEVNDQKSFIEGPFRESCGGDYFKGADVRPYYLKENPSEPQDWIKLANGIRKLSRQFTGDGSRDSRFVRPWLRTLDNIPASIRSSCRGPSELGDLVIHDEPEFWVSKERSGIRYFRCYRPARFYRVGWKHFFPEVQLACALLFVTDERGGSFPERGLTPRDAVRGYKLGWVPFS